MDGRCSKALHSGSLRVPVLENGSGRAGRLAAAATKPRRRPKPEGPHRPCEALTSRSSPDANASSLPSQRRHEGTGATPAVLPASAAEAPARCWVQAEPPASSVSRAMPALTSKLLVQPASAAGGPARLPARLCGRARWSGPAAPIAAALATPRLPAAGGGLQIANRPVAHALTNLQHQRGPACCDQTADAPQDEGGGGAADVPRWPPQAGLRPIAREIALCMPPRVHPGRPALRQACAAPPARAPTCSKTCRAWPARRALHACPPAAAVHSAAAPPVSALQPPAGRRG